MRNFPWSMKDYGYRRPKIHEFGYVAILSVLQQLAAFITIYIGFGRPFVKRFALCYRTVVSPALYVLSVLSVALVYCGQTV